MRAGFGRQAMGKKKNIQKKKRAAPRARRGPRISKVYTRGGDRGTTGLVGGQRVKKSSLRIEAYGMIDELGVCLGQARDEVDRILTEETPPPSRQLAKNLTLLDRHLYYIQNLLFSVGSELATRLEDHWPGMPHTSKRHVGYLEKLVDRYNESLPALADFILAGGGSLSVSLQSCRVVCRRAERQIHALTEEEPIGDQILPFVNRLSDLFFVLGRWTSAELKDAGYPIKETIWDRSLRQPPLPPLPPK